ncbi:MAG: alanine--tRNA ligase [Planctomycetes bacterium]|nr:alanine--tRNA ligase [Planctomycetota bacterium]
MNVAEVRRKYIEFFLGKGHAHVPPASLIPENDPTVLFTTAGMHPLVPYLLGEKHPAGTRLTSYQKCIRTGDIDDVGDADHLTFFEMLGNWSLGDYFKREAIEFSWEFLTSPAWLGIDPERLAITVFGGDDEVPADEEAEALWRAHGIPAERIFHLGREHNWWGPAGKTGPCGPDTEMFFIRDIAPCGPDCSPACKCPRYCEIWNDVFMQYNKQADGSYAPLQMKCVDTGMGTVRTAAVLQGKATVYETEVYQPLMDAIAARAHPEALTLRIQRILADHITASAFIIADGVEPSNLEAGYVLRRLIRRMVRFGRKVGIPAGFTPELAGVVIGIHADAYPELEHNRERIFAELKGEEEQFTETLGRGLREFEKAFAGVQKGRERGGRSVFPGRRAFELYSTWGFPPELTQELVEEQGLEWDQPGYDEAFKKHQEASTVEAGKFKSGLQDHSAQTVRLHTATHMLQAALRRVLGRHVLQKGSNITPERLRFDFAHGEKMTPEEIAETERIVNEKIAADLPVEVREMTLGEAKDAGAIGVFGDRYGERVKVYRIGDYSMELCGGPHVRRTGELGRFRILKEEASSKGVRRIRATVDPPAAPEAREGEAPA